LKEFFQKNHDFNKAGRYKIEGYTHNASDFDRKRNQRTENR